MGNFISSTAIIHPNVELGNNVIIEDFCIIGAPIFGKEPQKTIIGDGAKIRSHTVIYNGNKIGKNFQTGNKVNIRENNKIGDDVSIGTHSIIEHSIVIEDNVRIHSNVFIPEFTILKNSCWVGPNVVFTNAKYPLSKNVKNELVGPTIGKKAIIGANSTLLPGVNIADETIIGAGSVVVKDTERSQVYFGSPAKKKSSKDNLGKY